MKVYKIRHKPTGLFYTPTKGRWRDEKTNLHEKGKIYEIKPRFSQIYGTLSVSWNLYNKYKIECRVGDVVDKYKNPPTHECRIDFVEDDWEIVAYNCVEEVLCI